MRLALRPDGARPARGAGGGVLQGETDPVHSLAVFRAVLGFDLVGDGLRDAAKAEAGAALDPRMRTR